MSTIASPYKWLITFADVTDVSLRKLGDAYLSNNPDPSLCFYDLVALRLLDFAAQKGISLATINGVDPMHYMLIQWQIECLGMIVAESLMGLNDVDIRYDKWNVKYQGFKKALQDRQSKISFEMFLTANMQESRTRYGARSFMIQP
jgi:hypothetical protein